MRWWYASTGYAVAVEVVCGESPGEVPVEVKRAFDLFEGMHDGGMVRVVAFVSDGFVFLGVHVLLDAPGAWWFRATVIRSNDWTSSEPDDGCGPARCGRGHPARA